MLKEGLMCQEACSQLRRLTSPEKEQLYLAYKGQDCVKKGRQGDREHHALEYAL